MLESLPLNSKEQIIKKIRGNIKVKYTKKQIQESIKHWKKVLERMNESNDSVPVSIAHWTEIDPNPIDPNSPLFEDSKNVRTSNSS